MKVVDRHHQLIAQIEQLPCFRHDNLNIEPILAGLSQHCFKVCMDLPTPENNSQQGVYFVKSLDPRSANNEMIASSQVAKLGFAPSIVYQSPHWLVTDYIVGQTLDTLPMSTEQKIAIAMNLLTKLQRIEASADLNRLSMANLLEQQLATSSFDAEQVNILQCIIEQLVQRISQFDQDNSKVLCHGDLNFSNILIDQQNSSWLIDFEASLAGNIEYDIAMFIAVNNISLDLLPYIVGQYQQHADIVQSSAINQVLVLSYLAGCFLLNGLWYSSRTMTSKNNHKTDVVVAHHHNPYHQLAQQQYQRFDQLKLSQHKLTKLLP